jgi:hypothetical protein
VKRIVWCRKNWKVRSGNPFGCTRHSEG